MVKFDKTGFVKTSGQNINNNIFKVVPKSVTPANYIGYQINIDRKLTANQPYTIQFWNVDVAHSGRDESALGVFAYYGGGTNKMCGWAGTNYFTNGHADYLVSTFTPTQSQIDHAQSSNLWFNIYNSVPNVDGTRDMSIERWKLEEGEIATPWTMNEEDWGFVSADMQGFAEYKDMMSMFENHIQTREFIEW